jgi:hypothetical protein
MNGTMIEMIADRLKSYDLCVAVSDVRDGLHGGFVVPRKGDDIREINNAIQLFTEEAKKQGNADLIELLRDTATAPLDQLTILRKRVPRKPWKGEWSWKQNKYVGTGEYEGQERPQDHAPNWWKKERVISPDRYLESYAAASYHEELRREFWFAPEAAIKQAHSIVNEWCLDNGFKAVRKKPARKGRVSQATVSRMVDLGVLSRD